MTTFSERQHDLHPLSPRLVREEHVIPSSVLLRAERFGDGGARPYRHLASAGSRSELSPGANLVTLMAAIAAAPEPF